MIIFFKTNPMDKRREYVEMAEKNKKYQKRLAELQR